MFRIHGTHLFHLNVCGGVKILEIFTTQTKISAGFFWNNIDVIFKTLLGIKSILTSITLDLVLEAGKTNSHIPRCEEVIIATHLLNKILKEMLVNNKYNFRPGYVIMYTIH